MAGLNLDTLKKAAGAVSAAVSQNTSSGSAAQTANTAKSLPTDYTGSAQNVSTFTDSQDAIRAQMNANSLAWYGASPEEQERLHRENQALAALLGGSVSFDAGTGTWSGMADLPGTQTVQTAQTSQAGQTAQVEDYSSYLQQMYAAQKEAALAELKNAYEQNINAIDRAGAGVAEQYQAARNSTAGAGELAARNFNEYAAANGLNSGTGGQAELARGVTLQNNLNGIDTAEADTLADLELQRANAETEYNNAIARAEAQGDYELASALYQEKVRVQNALLDLAAQQQQYALQKYQLEYQAQRDQVGDQQWASELAFQQQKYSDSLAQSQQEAAAQQAQREQEDAAQLAQSQREALAGYGYAFLKQGVMPSTEMLAAMGITEADARSYIAVLQAQTGSTGGTSGGSSGGTAAAAAKAMDYAGLFAAAEQSGYAKSFIANNYKQYGFTSSTGLYDEYTQWLKEGGSSVGYRPAEAPVPDTSEYGSGYWDLVNELSAIESSGRNVATRAKNAIMNALEYDRITEDAAAKLLKQYGY